MLFLGGGHSVLLQHCGQIARRAVRLQTCCSVVMVVGDGVGIETLPGWYDTPVQEAGIAWPPCVTNTNKQKGPEQGIKRLGSLCPLAQPG